MISLLNVSSILTVSTYVSGSVVSAQGFSHQERGAPNKVRMTHLYPLHAVLRSYTNGSCEDSRADTRTDCRTCCYQQRKTHSCHGRTCCRAHRQLWDS